ncbi:Na+/H+ antiporter NhaA [Actinacidiphila glaucinigra]|uniref:Na+/H+ antiporter NhaA n=1 Tax=Actinacidiphila glaucinigra TaxID=235986 RepID=UPI0036ADD1BB
MRASGQSGTRCSPLRSRSVSLLGKIVGIFAGTYLAARFTRARLNPELARDDVFGLATLGGIGFTVALLIGELAFPATTQGEHVKPRGSLGAGHSVTRLMRSACCLLAQPPLLVCVGAFGLETLSALATGRPPLPCAVGASWRLSAADEVLSRPVSPGRSPQFPVARSPYGHVAGTENSTSRGAAGCEAAPETGVGVSDPDRLRPRAPGPVLLRDRSSQVDDVCGGQEPPRLSARRSVSYYRQSPHVYGSVAVILCCQGSQGATDAGGTAKGSLP